MDAAGNYSYAPGAAYGPSGLSGQYTAPNPTDFYSQNVSGCERLPNGNTLVCSGALAWIFEVTDSGQLIWEYTITGGGGAFRARGAAFGCGELGDPGPVVGEEPAREGPGPRAGGLQHLEFVEASHRPGRSTAFKRGHPEPGRRSPPRSSRPRPRPGPP